MEPGTIEKLEFDFLREQIVGIDSTFNTPIGQRLMVYCDYAASAPYVNIDMNPPNEKDDEDPSLDAIFISPHKFLGGPGSSGVLVFNERIYHKESIY